MNNNRKIILDVPVDAFQPEEFIELIKRGFQQPGVKTIFAVNAEKIMHARKDRELFTALKESDFLIPDGFGPVVGLRLKYGINVFRTTGVDLMKKLLDLSARKNYKVFIFGAKPDVVKRAAANIKEKYPRLNIVGTENGYIFQDEYSRLIDKINSSGADILFVGLGSPKQEKWLYRYKNYLNVKFCMGIGGSLDVIAEEVPLAPSWLSNIYLEWIYRLLKQPSRFKRQIVIPMFIFKMLKEALLSRL